jgi:hypothetical protein
MSVANHHAWRMFIKALRPFGEMSLLAAVLFFAGASWWVYALAALATLPYLRLRFRDVHEEWNS